MDTVIAFFKGLDSVDLVLVAVVVIGLIYILYGFFAGKEEVAPLAPAKPDIKVPPKPADKDDKPAAASDKDDKPVAKNDDAKPAPKDDGHGGDVPHDSEHHDEEHHDDGGEHYEH